tara:strand:+ start:111 stop:2123 length:2013 start_codon:yes stop_codon:yes gene_type:complete
MSKLDIAKFLMAAFNMVKRGDIKTLDDLFKFAKQQFGQVDPSLKNQIEDTFKKGQAAAITEKRTKDISKREKEEIEANKKFEETKKVLQEQMDILNDRTRDISRGDPTGEKKEGIKTLLQAVKKDMEELERLDDRNKEITKDLQDAITGQLFKRPEGSKDKAKPFQTPGMPFQRENPDYRIPGGSRYAEGNLRTAIRKFLETEINAGRLTVTDKDKVRVMKYSPFTEDDPIDVFRRYYGETALDSADKMASKLEMGESFSDYERIFRENMPELKIKTEGAGQYDQSIADAEAALKQGAEDKKNLEILEDFDVEGRKKNNMGGINRASFAEGKIKLAVFLAGKGKNLTDEIRKAVDNIFPSGDRKVDADMALDDMYENLGINRDVVDMKDDMKAYGEAYDLLSTQRASRGGLDDIRDARLIDDMYRTAGPRSLDEDKMYLAEFIADDAGKVLDDLPASEQKIFIDRAERALIKNVKKYQDLPPPGSRGGPDDIAAPFSDEKVELPEGVDPRDTILPTGNIKRTFKGVEVKDPTFDLTMPYDNDAEKLAEIKMSNEAYDMEKARGTEPTGSLISKRLKTMRIADEIKPGLFENLTDTQTEIIEKYGDLVDMDLLKNIVLDPDPNNQAAALATLEEAMVLMKKGIGPDEAVDILKKGSRTKQAEGGLSYLMGM